MALSKILWIVVISSELLAFVASQYGYVKCPDGSSPQKDTNLKTISCTPGQSYSACQQGYQCVTPLPGRPGVCCPVGYVAATPAPPPITYGPPPVTYDPPPLPGTDPPPPGPEPGSPPPPEPLQPDQPPPDNGEAVTPPPPVEVITDGQGNVILSQPNVLAKKSRPG